MESTVIIQKISFFSKLDISLSFTKIGGIMGIFVLFKIGLMVDQYVFYAFSKLTNLAFTLVTRFFIALVINDVHPLT